jgi:hypothetical protein
MDRLKVAGMPSGKAARKAPAPFSEGRCATSPQKVGSWSARALSATDCYGHPAGMRLMGIAGSRSLSAGQAALIYIFMRTLLEDNRQGKIQTLRWLDCHSIGKRCRIAPAPLNCIRLANANLFNYLNLSLFKVRDDPCLHVHLSVGIYYCLSPTIIIVFHIRNYTFFVFPICYLR